MRKSSSSRSARGSQPPPYHLPTACHTCSLLNCYCAILLVLSNMAHNFMYVTFGRPQFFHRQSNHVPVCAAMLWEEGAAMPTSNVKASVKRLKSLLDDQGWLQCMEVRRAVATSLHIFVNKVWPCCCADRMTVYAWNSFSTCHHLPFTELIW